MKYLTLLILCSTVAFSQTIHGRYIQGDTVKGTTWVGLPAGAGAWQGWYVNGNSLVTDTLRFLTPTSMVFVVSGRTVAIYPDTGTGKIATKSDVAAKLGLHATADSAGKTDTARASHISDTARTAESKVQMGIDTSSNRTYSNALYESKAQMGTDTSSNRTNSNALYESKAQMGTDTSSNRTNSNALYESKAQMGTDTSSVRTNSNALYESKTQMGTDTTNFRTNSTSIYAPKASPTFTGRWTGSASIRGTATFTTTGVRVAVYVPGTASGDIVVCTPTLSTVVTTTNLTAFAKTDSLIFMRGASGTNGAVLNWILMR